MNDFFGNIIENKAQTIFELNCNNKKNRNPGKNIFQKFTPKRNSKDNNPKDIFNANNELNLILSKNLKSIYNETKNELIENTPIYNNVNCLIKKNTKSNFKKFMNSRKLSVNLQSNYNVSIKPSKTMKKKFKSTDKIHLKYKFADDISEINSVKNTVNLGKKTHISKMLNKKEKEFNTKIDKGAHHKKKSFMYHRQNKRKSSPLNKNIFKRPQIPFTIE